MVLEEGEWVSIWPDFTTHVVLKHTLHMSATQKQHIQSKHASDRLLFRTQRFSISQNSCSLFSAERTTCTPSLLHTRRHRLALQTKGKFPRLITAYTILQRTPLAGWHLPRKPQDKESSSRPFRVLKPHLPNTTSRALALLRSSDFFPGMLCLCLSLLLLLLFYNSL